MFLEVAQFEARDAEEFLARCAGIDWTAHLGPGATLACDFSGRHPTITHTHFGALKLKDAIVDSLREARGARPDVAPERPDVRVHAHAHGASITLAIDLSGESLHRRGYRAAGGEAPLKENVAAGVLLRAGWPELAAAGAEFLDPLCGSGTFCIEAALIACDRAPGLTRDYFGFLGWQGHDAALWQRLHAEAAARAGAAGQPHGCVRGSDRDAAAIRAAQDNARRAGVEAQVHFATGALAAAAPATERGGLLCTNPPYGVRLEDREAARGVHRELGAVLRERFQGWDAAVLTGAPELGRELGCGPTARTWSGMAPSSAACCACGSTAPAPASRARWGAGWRGTASHPGRRCSPTASRRTSSTSKSWRSARASPATASTTPTCPSTPSRSTRYAVIEPQQQWLYVQEYAAPAEIEAEAVRRRRAEVLARLPEATGVAPERIRVRTTRRRTRRGEQYQKADEQGRFHVVLEAGLKFHVNFEDYLDTGLFLDHRLTRARLRAAARGARFLNLFGYTGTATVYAAAGGAAASTTVDLSRTYLEWAQRNLALNGLAAAAHAFVQADCRAWLARGGARRHTLRPDIPRSADLLEFQAHGGRARHRARPCAADRCSACGCWRPADCWCSRPMPSASASTRRCRGAAPSATSRRRRCRRTSRVIRACIAATRCVAAERA